MGQLFSGGGLTTPNSALQNPQGQTTFVGSPSQVLSKENQSIPTIPDVSNGPNGRQLTNPSTANMPSAGTPSFLQAATAGAQPGGVNAASPGLSKLGKLGVLLTQGVQGALAGRASSEQAILESGGRRSGGIGMGMEAGITLPWRRAQQLAQTQLAQGQVQNLPWQRAALIAGVGKTQAETGKDTAEAGQLAAETAAMPSKTALEDAQALAARYKEDPASGALIDLQTRQPVNGGQMIPVQSQEMAGVLNVPIGTQVPLTRAAKAADLLTKGITTVNTAQGVFERNRITGKNTRLGDNPREITLDMPTGVLDTQTGQQTMVTKRDIIANPGRYAPTGSDIPMAVKKQTEKEFASTKPGTAGGNAIAFNTAIGHLGMLNDAVDALGNSKYPIFNNFAQQYAKQTGSSAPTNFDTVRNAVAGEVAKVFKGGVPADAEIQEQSSVLSKTNSPEQLKGAIRDTIGLMNSRLSALQERHTSIMGRPAEGLITKDAQAVMDKLQGGGATPTGMTHAVIVNGKTVGYTADGKTMVPAQ
jgi:hypothetical protein